MQGGITVPATSAPPTPGSEKLQAATVVFLIALIAFIVILAIALSGPAPASGTGAVPPSPASIGFQIPWRFGNASAGWTYALNVTVQSQDQPQPIVWGNVRVTFMYNANLTSTYPYMPPGQTTVQVAAAGGTVLARENLSSALWTDGYFVPVETGQVLVVHGNLPPGTDYVHNGMGTFTGPGLVIQFANAGQPFTMLYPFQGNWVYT